MKKESMFTLGFLAVFGLMLVIGIFDLVDKEPIFDILGVNYWAEGIFLIAASSVGIIKGLIELKKIRE